MDYHAGERHVQRRAGVSGEARQVQGLLRPTLSPAMARALADFRLAVAASRDADGKVWASLLSGPPGFVRALDDSLVLLAALPSPHDPLSSNLARHAELGLLLIDLPTRRRLRLNGRALVQEEHGLFLQVQQAYGNCPRHIQPRETEPVPAAGARAELTRASFLDRDQQDVVAAADTFFIASAHPEAGADASHRGGPPGFVRVLDERTLAFPEYPGNNMFNTLGNLTLDPRAGLLFLDFETGDTLQVTGRARLDWSPAAVAAHGSQGSVVVGFDIDEVLMARRAGLRRAVSHSDGNGISTPRTAG